MSLLVHLRSGTNLKDADSIGKSDPYCTFEITGGLNAGQVFKSKVRGGLGGMRRQSFRKSSPTASSYGSGGGVHTQVIQDNLNPVWDERLTLAVDADRTASSLKIKVRVCAFASPCHFLSLTHTLLNLHHVDGDVGS